jgi:hypothetical protein
MPRIFLFLCLCAAWGGHAAGSVLLTRDGRPCPELLEIGKVLRLDWGTDARTVNDYMQKHFIRPKGSERHNIPPSPYEPYADLLIPIARRVGMVDPILPPSRIYDYLLLMGQEVPMMRAELDFARRLEIDGHVHFEKIICLAGQRPLVASLDAADPFFANCGDESSAMRRLVESYFPDRLEDCHFIASRVHYDGRRPNTHDTVISWLQTQPPVGSILMVSNNPFTLYQGEILRGELERVKWFEKGGTLTPCGNSIALSYTRNNRVAVLLENIARLFYVELCNYGEH